MGRRNASIGDGVIAAMILLCGGGANAIELKGKDTWKDSGITVQAGAVYRVTASGFICTEGTCNACCTYDPDGKRADGSGNVFLAPSEFPAPGLIPYSLVGRVNGLTVQLGSNRGFSAPDSGTLQIIFNDAPNGDNEQSFDVQFACLPGDLDSNGVVDLTDVAILLSHYGETGNPSYDDGDLDGDGIIDLTDLAAMLSQYGKTCG